MQGMPKVVAPSNEDEDWLLWFHFRDDKLSPELVKLSTGRIAFAKSKDGISNWVFVSPTAAVMNPSKESGDWCAAISILNAPAFASLYFSTGTYSTASMWGWEM